MDSSITTSKTETELPNPNAKLHSTVSKKLFKRQCIPRQRVIKRQNRSLSKLERDFQSLLSISPTIESDPKSTLNPNSGLQVQRRYSIKCHEFLVNEFFDGEGGEGESLEFFRGLFEKDEILRGIYVNNSAMGKFVCLVCGWSGEKNRKMYGGCIGLVGHACTVKMTKKIGAHRAFGRVVCDVLGWDVNEYLNIYKSKVDDKWRKFNEKNVSYICFCSDELYSDVVTMCYNPRAPYQQVMPTHRSYSGMDLDRNDFEVDIDNRDESKGYDDIVEKVQGLNFNETFSGADCNTFQSSTSFERNKCSKNFTSTNFLLQIMSTRRADCPNFGTLGPTIGQCIEKLKNLHGLSPESELFSFACNFMRSNENREIFMQLGDDMARYSWLESNYNKDGEKKS